MITVLFEIIVSFAIVMVVAVPFLCERVLHKEMSSFKEMSSPDGKTHITEGECKKILLLTKMCHESSAYIFYEEGVKTLVVASCASGNIKVYNLVVAQGT